MNYTELLEAHKKFVKLEPRYFFYDGYMSTQNDFWFRNGRVNEHEIKKLHYFIRSWDPHFSGTIKKLNNRFEKIRPHIMVLKNKSIDRINLDNEKTKKLIQKIFNSLAVCGKKNKFQSTDASKIMHAILPKLFVMWDKSIRNGIWKDSGWKIPEKFKGREYSCRFLPLMKEEARDVLRSYAKEKYRRGKQGGNEIEEVLDNYSLAKLLDEYNYVKYTKKDPLSLNGQG